MDSNPRKKEKKNFKEDYFKLMNNAVFEKLWQM